MSKMVFTILMPVLILFLASCKHSDYAANVYAYNIQESFDINNKHSILYVDRGSGSLECIFPWASFVQFGRYDLTNVQNGTIRLRTGVTEHGTITYDANLGDANAFNYDHILLCWENEGDKEHLIITSTPITTIGNKKLYDLGNGTSGGIAFELQDWGNMNYPENFEFSLWGSYNITDQGTSSTQYVQILENPTSPSAQTAMFLISFIKSSFSGLSMQEKHNIDPANITDARFQNIITQCTNYVTKGDLILKKDIPAAQNNEKDFVGISAENMRKYLADLLLSYIQNSRSHKYPAAGDKLDSNLVLYTNVNATLNAMQIYGSNGDAIVYLAFFDPIDALICGWQITVGDAKDRLNDYLDALIGKSVDNFTPQDFDDLIWNYTDYLLYAGIICLFNDDFNSRYFNYLDGIVSEMENLMNTIHTAYHDNNFVIRFYAAASLYDFIKNQNRSYYQKFCNYYQAMVDAKGEWGEGYKYLGSDVNDIVLPVLYLATQEKYTYNRDKNSNNIGQYWVDRSTDQGIQWCIKTSESMINVSDKWGEIPAIDDGFNFLPWLAPMAVIADDKKYLDYTINNAYLSDNETNDLLLIMNFSTSLVAQLLTYPYNKTFTISGSYIPADGVQRSGSGNLGLGMGGVVKMHISNNSAAYNDQISLALITKYSPELPSTHHQEDHGAIQLNRYVDRHNGHPHVDHLIIDPGYRHFTEDKRDSAQFEFRNQNVLMLYNHDIDAAKDGCTAIFASTDELNAPLYDPFSSSRYGGMPGYNYMTHSEVADVFQILFSTSIMQSVAADYVQNSILRGDNAGGNSEVVQTFTNGAQSKIHYEYRLPSCNNNAVTTQTYKGCNARREIYNLGNSFYVVDRFPISERQIYNISFATSWNLPANSASVAGRAGCYTGSLPISGPVQSRIQIDVKGCTVPVVVNNPSYSLAGGTPYQVRQLIFENNNVASSDFMIADISVIDGFESFRTLAAGGESYNTTNNVTVWKKIYTDGSSEIFILNVNNNLYTYSDLNITSDAKIWIIHSDVNSTGKVRLFYYSTVTPSSHTINSQNGGQCDITL